MTALAHTSLVPARAPRSSADGARLLVTDRATAAVYDSRITELAQWLRPGDLLVVNDAATLPGSLRGQVQGAPIELRLLSVGHDPVGRDPVERDPVERARAVLFGAGEWRTPTEHRPPPPLVQAGDLVELDGLSATVTAVPHPRLIELRFDREGAALWSAIYRLGRPIQYSHLRQELELWDVNTAYAGRPWAVEPPSAGLPLRGAVLASLRRAGVAVTAITHAAGISTTGDDALDATLPLPERSDVPQTAIDAIDATRARGGRVIAVGTSVTRALEGNAARHGRLVAEDAITDLRLDAGSALRVVDGLLTGMHDPGASHMDLLRAFLDEDLLAASYLAAERLGYLGHELGDLHLIL